MIHLRLAFYLKHLKSVRWEQRDCQLKFPRSSILVSHLGETPELGLAFHFHGYDLEFIPAVRWG